MRRHGASGLVDQLVDRVTPRSAICAWKARTLSGAIGEHVRPPSEGGTAPNLLPALLQSASCLIADMADLEMTRWAHEQTWALGQRTYALGPIRPKHDAKQVASSKQLPTNQRRTDNAEKDEPN
jgi:hypothetical protein